MSMMIEVSHDCHHFFVRSSNVAAISLPSVDDKEGYTGQNAVVSGWGTTSSGGTSPLRMQFVEVGVISDSGERALS